MPKRSSKPKRPTDINRLAAQIVGEATGQHIESKTEKNPAAVALGRLCYKCRATEMIGKPENYRYTECGLSNVVLMDLMVYRCQHCGAVVPEIPNIAGLHEFILLDLITKHTLLVGEEIRFVRKMAGLSAAELAKVLGVRAESLSRWETDAQSVDKEVDRVLRLFSFSRMLQELICESTAPPNTQSLVTAVLDAAKRYSELDVFMMLQAIKNIAEGPKEMRISPGTKPRHSRILA